MKIRFIEGYDRPYQLLVIDLLSAPSKTDTVAIGETLYEINSVRHMFTPTGRGNQHEYEVEVRVQKAT